MDMAGQVVTVKRAALEACMTCPLCNKLLREATPVSLCLHTFCRKCIYNRLSDEEVVTCPVCDIDLGCLPEEKLRPDHNLQDIRAKIFPLKRRRVELATEVVTSIALPTKRKERSLSSLVVSTPNVPVQTGSAGRRSKSGPRKTLGLQGCSLTTEESNKDEEDSAEEDHHPISSSSPDPQNKIPQRKRQHSSAAEPSNEQQQMDANGEDDDGEVVEGKVDLWTPLNCLVEAANRTKLLKSNSQGQSVANSEILSTGPDLESKTLETKLNVDSPIVGHSGDTYILPKSNNKEPDQGFDIEDHDKGSNNLFAPPVKHRRLTVARRRAALSEVLSASAQAVLDAAMNKANRRNCPVWFSLVASDDKRGDASLPQIPTCYLRIKDGKMSVSFIQKYIVKKLELSGEAEVEIMCRGQPVVPTLQLQNLVDLWFRNASSKRVDVSVGSSAKGFVMVLSYCRKLQQ